MSEPRAYLVDDDEAIRDALSWLLKSRGIPCASFDSAESFLTAWKKTMSGCLVLDMRMTGMSGLDCFDQLRERESTRSEEHTSELSHANVSRMPSSA